MAAPSRADLHVHSTCSDGTLSPAELASRASILGLSAIALTDHDSVEGIRPCRDAAQALGLRCLPAVELSTRSGDRDAHVLGYFIDPTDPTLLAELERLRAGRRRRIERMARRLAESGVPVDLDRLLAAARGGALGRAHLGRALVAEGRASDLTDAFRRYIGRGRPFYEPADVPTPAEAVATIRDAGGLPVLAHPAISGVSDLVPELAEQGLAGVEAYHADHTPAQALELDREARRLGLLVTGGSDYHGPDGRTPEMGSVELPPGTLEALLRAANPH